MSRAAVRRGSCTRRALIGLLVLLSSPLSCAASRPAPPRAPVLATSTDAVPPDLDLVVRVDLAKVRAALGPAGLALVRRGAAGTLAADAETALVANAIEHSDTAVLAVRPELIPGEADNVLVLVGHFAGLGVEQALRQSGWSNATDLGGDVRRFERKGKVSRAGAARVYAFRDEALVFVSPAEVDSVEAVIERGMAPNPLRPKATGVLAFAARLRALRLGLGSQYPSLAHALGDAAGVAGNVESTGTGLAVELAFELPSEAAAGQSAADLARVQEVVASTEGKLATMAHDTKIEAVGRYVVLHLALERGIL
jgi:hypothetical protein